MVIYVKYGSSFMFFYFFILICYILDKGAQMG